MQQQGKEIAQLHRLAQKDYRPESLETMKQEEYSLHEGYNQTDIDDPYSLDHLLIKILAWNRGNGMNLFSIGKVGNQLSVLS